MVEKYISLNLGERKTKEVAEILSNKSCSKILDILVDKDLSESEIAESLSMPANTVNYNVKKLKDVGLVEEKIHFWSRKNRRIPVYTVSSKKIIISPRKVGDKLKNKFPVIFISALFTFFLLLYDKTNLFYKERVSDVTPGVMGDSSIAGAIETITFLGLGVVDWFLIGLWLAIIIFISKSIIGDSRN